LNPNPKTEADIGRQSEFTSPQKNLVYIFEHDMNTNEDCNK